MRAQEIVEAARMAVFTPVEGPTDSLRQLAGEYKALCERVNERLARCGELLRKGNRSEAIRLAEIEPNLLDLVALADFPERDSFVELCQYLNLDAAPPLLVEIAAELNEAYAREQPLEGLLRRYRRLALVRAPLKPRLQVVRQLAQIDGQNLYWKKDQDFFEKERLREIQREMAEAVQKRDVGVLQALAEELQQPGWLDPPPESLIQTIQRHRNEVSRQIARGELQELTRELHEAWERFDVAEARRVRTAWQQMAQLAQLDADDPMRQEAAPAFAWLAEEDQKEAEEAACRQAMANLERALDRKEKSLPRLQKLYREATRSGRELPTYLERMYQLRVEDIQRIAKWRMRRNLTLGGLSAVILTLLAVWGLAAYQTYQQYRQTANSLQNLLSSIETSRPADALALLEQAKILVDRLETQTPSYQNWSPLPEQCAKIKSLLEQHRGRQEQLAQKLEQVRSFLQQESKTLSRNDFDVCQTKLREAQQLAISEEEKLRVGQVHNECVDRKLRWQQEKDQQFREQLRPLVERLAEVEKSRDAAEETFQKAFQINSELTQLAQTHPDISDPARTELALLREKSKKLEEHWQEKLQEQRREERLVQLAGSHDAFVQELKKCIQQSDDASRRIAYQRLLEEQTYWKQLDQWNRYAQQWNGSWEARTPLMKDAKWLAAFQQWTDFPGAEAIASILPYLEAVQNQSGDDQKRLQAMLEIPPFQQVWVLQHEEKFYYFQQPPAVKPGATMGVEYIADYDLNLRRVALTFGENPANPILAPHHALCKDLGTILKSTDLNNWEKNFCQMLHTVLTTPGEPIAIDPSLRLFLLRNILRTAAKGSYPINQGFGDWLTRLAGGPLDAEANWLDPQKPGYLERRRSAAEFLQRFPVDEFAKNQQKAADLWKQFRAYRLPEFRWVGVVQYDASSAAWRGDVKNPEELASVAENLYVLIPKEQGTARVVLIGERQAGSIRLKNPTHKEALLQGRPIFGLLRDSLVNGQGKKSGEERR